MEVIKEIINLYGLQVGLAVIFIFVTIFCYKVVIEKTIESIISSKYSKKIAEYENKIYKRTLAYKIILEKELNFYDKYYDYASTLITDIQDVSYYFENNIKDSKDVDRLKKYIINVLEIIPKIKKELLLYESYCNESVKIEVTKLIVMLQKEFAQKIKIFIEDEKKIKKEQIIKICDNVLMQLAKISVMIIEREKKLVEE